MADTLLLVGINFLVALVHSSTVTTTFAIVLIHILIIMPMLCITVWFCGVLLIKFGVFCNKCTKRRLLETKKLEEEELEESIRDREAPTIQRVRVFQNSDREPLIRIMDYQ